MKALAISYKGMEDITALEIKEILGENSNTEEKESCVIFDVGSMEDIARYCYRAQGVNRVLVLLDEFEISSVSDLKRISRTDFSDFIKDKMTFAARAETIENDLDAGEIEKATGDEIDSDVDLDNPDVTVFVYIYDNRCYAGIDASGDLSKRDYKIFTTRGDLKGTIAYALVRLSGYSADKSFLNLDAKAGTVAIEAALFGSGFSANYHNKERFSFLKFFDIDLGKFDEEKKEVSVYAYDSQGYAKVIKNNAKIADVEVKYENKEDADCIVRHTQEKAEIRGIDKEREIRHGKETIHIVGYKNKK